jgi:hypothetical protein
MHKNKIKIGMRVVVKPVINTKFDQSWFDNQKTKKIKPTVYEVTGVRGSQVFVKEILDDNCVGVNVWTGWYDCSRLDKV